MIINDFTADVSTFNFGTDKETQVVHDTLHAKGVTTIGELCHLSKKHIEALGLDPSLIELHLKKNGLSLGMCDNDILQHQRIASELLKNDSEKPSTNKPAADIQVKKIIESFCDLDVDWSDRHFELAKSLYLSDHCIFRSKEKKMRRAFFLANNILTQYYALTTASLEYLKKE
jgi:hypothetical protein